MIRSGYGTRITYLQPGFGNKEWCREPVTVEEAYPRNRRTKMGRQVVVGGGE
jgi:hypothetical protein